MQISIQVVLLICEYMIVVETNNVQNKHLNRSGYIPQDVPVADKLGRSDFGFDQDYFERMPLLINALQENKESVPTVKISIPLLLKKHHMNTVKLKTTTPTNFIRKTSPRPFLLEYKGPYPRPFGKPSSSSRSWVESYRNTERMKNLQELVKYLEKTINAKFGDMYIPSKTQLAFSTVIVAPLENTNQRFGDGYFKHPRFKSKGNHKLDPLYTFRPNSPQDVNLLADDSDTGSNNNRYKYSSKISLAAPNRLHNKKCVNSHCINNNNDPNFLSYNEVNSFKESQNNRTKSINFMVDLYPLKSSNNVNTKDNVFDSSKIHFTTIKPVVHFRRKNPFSGRRYSHKNKKLSARTRTITNTIPSNPFHSPDEKHTTTVEVPKMIVHLNVISIPKLLDDSIVPGTDKNNLDTTIPPITTPQTKPEFIQEFPEINLTNVEDYHVGSSGILPVSPITTPPPTYLITTPIVPLFVQDTPSVVTQPPDVVKFSPEDAKIPDQYLNLRKFDVTEEYPENFENMKFGEKLKVRIGIEHTTLAVRLKNYLKTTTEETTTYETTTYTTEGISETYVPQMNGHYRNLKYKSLSLLLKENSEKYRKKLGNIVSATRKSTRIPEYVVIQRNHTTNS